MKKLVAIKQHIPARKTEPEASARIRKFSRDLVLKFKTKTPKSQKKGKQ